MKLIKIKGIVIKETSYKDNDKIITLLTDTYGKISCMAKGAKKTNSPILANCQYLVYSEFVLYKGTNFYHVNSASIINMFYKLRTDFEKLQIMFELTKIVQMVTDENQDTGDILKLFLNTAYAIENFDKDKRIIASAFKIKLFTLLGFAPRIDKCHICGQAFSSDKESLKDGIYYDFVSNVFICSKCLKKENQKRCIKLNEATIVAIKYVVLSGINKIFSFSLKNIDNFSLFGEVYTDTMTSGI